MFQQVRGLGAKRRWKAGAATLVLAGALIGLPSLSASAAASIIPINFSSTETFADAPPECMPTVKAGVTTATESGSGIVVVNSNGTTAEFTGENVYRTDFTDGSYLTGDAHSHFTISSHSAIVVQSEVIVEPRTIYSADGSVVGSVIIHAITHFTVNTVTGEASSTIDRFFFTCR
jgi:hypothetical protein